MAEAAGTGHGPLTTSAMRLLAWVGGGVLTCFLLFLVSLNLGNLGVPRADAQAQRLWETVVEPKSGFRLEMPGTPKLASIGEGYRSHELQQGATRYFAQFTFFYGPDKTDADLQRLLDEFATKLEGGRWASVTWVRRGGLTAADAVGVQSGHDLRYLTTAKGSLVIDLVYSGPIGTARSVDVNRFVGSLRSIH